MSIGEVVRNINFNKENLISFDKDVFLLAKIVVTTSRKPCMTFKKTSSLLFVNNFSILNDIGFR